MKINKFILSATMLILSFGCVFAQWKHLFKSGEATFHEKKHFKEVTAQKYRLKVL